MLWGRRFIFLYCVITTVKSMPTSKTASGNESIRELVDKFKRDRSIPLRDEIIGLLRDKVAKTLAPEPSTEAKPTAEVLRKYQPDRLKERREELADLYNLVGRLVAACMDAGADGNDAKFRELLGEYDKLKMEIKLIDTLLWEHAHRSKVAHDAHANGKGAR